MLDNNGTWNPGRAYSQSKLAQILFTIELAERLPRARRRRSTRSIPPPIWTRTWSGGWGRRRSATVDDGAEATLRLAVGDNVDGITGRFYDVLNEATPDPQAFDHDARRRLWQLSAELTGSDGLPERGA